MVGSGNSWKFSGWWISRICINLWRRIENQAWKPATILGMSQDAFDTHLATQCSRKTGFWCCSKIFPFIAAFVINCHAFLGVWMETEATDKGFHGETLRKFCSLTGPTSTQTVAALKSSLFELTLAIATEEHVPRKWRLCYLGQASSFDMVGVFIMSFVFLKEYIYACACDHVWSCISLMDHFTSLTVF